MKKMTVSEMQKANGGFTYRCVCGYTTKWAIIYNNHMKYFCVYGRRFLEGKDSGWC